MISPDKIPKEFLTAAQGLGKIDKVFGGQVGIFVVSICSGQDVLVEVHSVKVIMKLVNLPNIKKMELTSGLNSSNQPSGQ